MDDPTAPAATPLGFAPSATTEQVAERLMRAKRERRPFSLIRLGDGEGAVLAYPDFSGERALVGTQRLTFGRKLEPDELAEVRREMAGAVAQADVIGVHAGDTLDRFTSPRAALGAILPPEREPPMLCRAYVSIHLAKADLLTDLIAGERRVGVISCNDLTDVLTTRLGVGRVDYHPVPSEADRAIGRQNPAGDTWTSRAHYPHVFHRLRRRLRVREPGQIFLVGAGLLAKAYCGWIKERGGIALDLGSVLDGWAGLATRKYLLADPGGYRLGAPPPAERAIQAISAS